MHAGSHKIEAKVVGTMAIGSAVGFVVYKHFEKKKIVLMDKMQR